MGTTGEAAVILERKRKPDGTTREYTCHLVTRRPGLLVVRFALVAGGETFDTPVDIPPGSVSYGWFWSRRPYAIYRIFGPDDSLVAHRFDAVADVRLLDDAVEYRDLVLDWWVLPDDTILEEDRDELDALAAIGSLPPRDVAAANRTALEIFSRYRHIIEELDVLERRLAVR